MDGGAWWAAVHGVAKSWTWLSDFTFTFHFHALEEEMATHSSVLAWRIPGMAGPGGLPSMGSHRVGHDWSDLAAAAAGFNWWWVETCFLYSSMTLSMRQVCGGLLMAEMPCNSHCQIGLLFSLSNQKTFFKNLLNWSIITWQYCDGFCHASVWIGHRYTWPPILNPPPASLPTLSL